MRTAWLTRPALWMLVAAGLVSALAAACGNSGYSSATASVAPSAGSSAAASGSTTGTSTTVKLTAKDIKYDTNRITVPAGQKITVDFTSFDSVQHTFAIYNQKGDPNSLFVAPFLTGPNKSETFAFTAPAKPGNYYFQCDVHPAQMNGTLVVT